MQVFAELRDKFRALSIPHRQRLMIRGLYGIDHHAESNHLLQERLRGPGGGFGRIDHGGKIQFFFRAKRCGIVANFIQNIKNAIFFTIGATEAKPLTRFGNRLTGPEIIGPRIKRPVIPVGILNAKAFDLRANAFPIHEHRGMTFPSGLIRTRTANAPDGLHQLGIREGAGKKKEIRLGLIVHTRKTPGIGQEQHLCAKFVQIIKGLLDAVHTVRPKISAVDLKKDLVLANKLLHGLGLLIQLRFQRLGNVFRFGISRILPQSFLCPFIQKFCLHPIQDHATFFHPINETLTHQLSVFIQKSAVISKPDNRRSPVIKA